MKGQPVRQFTRPELRWIQRPDRVMNMYIHTVYTVILYSYPGYANNPRMHNASISLTTGGPS